ncbi:ribokinase [Camelliibacillus cellulosilyticus]|uniref:Ribokinase n=1 Tax=Camelliibacillus cellulosilyticus TaxID=2174486 RepID=A0ABV9GQJ6_9BACL
MKVTVIGSLNMDLVTEASVLPKRGETVFGEQFTLQPGGKGANQAVAAARLGAEVTMVGCVGKDVFGEQIRANLAANGVRTDYIRDIPDVSSGTATIMINNGDNRIIVVAGANSHLLAEDIHRADDAIRESDVVLLQLETPLETVTAAAHAAKSHGALVILNPAPYRTLPSDLLELVDYITPNKLEFDAMMRQGLSKDIAKKIIVTKGKEGSRYFDGTERVKIPSFAVEVVDTTGAGDTFNGALGVALGAKKSLHDAVVFANAAGALSVTRWGAQAGMPTLEDVVRFIDRTS